MKQLLFIIAWACWSLPSLAQEEQEGQEGIAFEELAYEKALAKAKQENKYLFVDCYTSWCKPCKMMDATVFTLKEAGEYFAPRFVAVKYDMEKGEGIEIGKRFDVKAFPTYLLVKPDGVVAHRVVGSASWPAFMQKLERGTNPGSNLNYLKEQHEQGKLDNDGIALYRQALVDAYDTEALDKLANAPVATATKLEVEKKEGIVFEELSYEKALAKARQENKYLFVDCYTTWCGPCKFMDANVFTLKEAGEYFTPRFVAVKYDMEKGEGIDLVKPFGIKSYPTYLVVRPDGVIAHRIVGSSGWPAFMQKLERGLTPGTCLEYLEKQYQQGKLDSKGLRQYMQALEDDLNSQAAKRVSDELIANMTDKERLTPEAWPLLSDRKHSPFASDNYKFILKNRERLSKTVGREQVEDYLRGTWSPFLSSFHHLDTRMPRVSGERRAELLQQLQELKQIIRGMNINSKEFLLARCAVSEAAMQQDGAGIVKAIESALPFLPANDDGAILAAVKVPNGPREAFKELADLYDRYLNALPAGRRPEWVEQNRQLYHKQAHAGLHFEQFSLDEALLRGQTRWQVPVYVWAYTAGNAACREMENVVFTGEGAWEASRSVVCVKYDLESPEGKQLRETYGISNLTSVHLLLKPDGTEISRLPGTPDEGTFIEWMKKYGNRSGK
jgi:thiol-disulfide isomerase/thioredoxin